MQVAIEIFFAILFLGGIIYFIGILCGCDTKAAFPESYSLSQSAQLLAYLTFPISWLGLSIIVFKIFGPSIELEWRLLSIIIPFIIAWQLCRLVAYSLFRSNWSWTKE
jgi:hypothetical protein